MQLQEGTSTSPHRARRVLTKPAAKRSSRIRNSPQAPTAKSRNDTFQSFYGFVASGTVTITKSGSGYRFVLDFTTDKGHKVSGTYEGNVEMTDKR